MVDNIKLILPLLTFNCKDDFYYLQILQRKKENPQLGSNSRVIKNYYITSEDYLINRYDEIIELCKVFNARAMIRLNKRSFEKVGYKTMVNLSNTIMNKEFSFLSKSYDRACGLGHNDLNKTWILDIDFKDCNEVEVSKALNFTVPYELIVKLPSKNGVHFITKPFRLDTFIIYCKKNEINVEIHKDNPTNLYIP